MREIVTDRVRVQIMGREYDMDPGGLTALEVQSVAHFVDERMREIQDRFSIVDTQKIAVLACLNIALDYLQSNGNGQIQRPDITAKLQELSKILDEALDAR